MKNELLKLRLGAINFMHQNWSKDCLNNNILDIGTKNFECLSEIAFNALTNNVKKSKAPFIFRTAGQAGSGKTTQLLPAIESAIINNKADFVNLSVRYFSKYHPNYQQILKEFGQELIREKTNGFALLLLFRVLEKLILNKYNILFEVTLLDYRFEKYIIKLAKTKGYIMHFHVLSVPRSKSDYWIEKRKHTSLLEANRVVLKSSSDLFYNVLYKTLENIIYYNIWTKKDLVCLWNGYEIKPVIFGQIYRNVAFLQNFIKYRDNDDFQDFDEQILLENKKIWFNEYYDKKI